MISAIIVNYYTKILLPPLLDELTDNHLISQIIIVDNSRELDSFYGHSHKIHVIVNTENKGFAGAVNQAVAVATEQWLLLVNPDVRLEKQCIRNLLDAAQRYNASIASPRFFWDDNYMFRLPPATGMSLWFELAQRCSVKYQLDADTFSFYWMLRHERYWEAVSPFAEPFVAGTCLLVDKSWGMDKNLNLFDDHFFVYFEDTDLCVKALQDNAVILCVPDAKAVHYYDQSPSQDRSKGDLMNESFEVFQNKYYPGIKSFELGNDAYLPEMIDLGKISAPPVFKRKAAKSAERFFFEIGVNSFLVPFAQADVNQQNFYFPDDVWHRLRQGQYFCRIRGAISGVQQVWAMEK